MADLELEAENRLRASRQRRTAQALAWMQMAQTEMAERAKLRQTIASLTTGKEVMTTSREGNATLSLVSLEWREAHKNDRCSFLFHEVFPHLFRSGYLDTQDVLKFRLMSKQSKESVENCLSSTLQPHRYFENEVKVESVDMLPICIFIFGNPGKVARFNNWSRSQYSGENPFFSRQLGIGGLMDMRVPVWKDNQEFWRGIEILLRRWGTQIWHVGIQFDKGMFPRDVYRQLYRHLLLMPNLRSIILQDPSRGGVNPSSEMDMLRVLGKDAFGPLKKEMKKCPLPKLRFLTHISFDAFMSPPIIHEMLTKYNGQLEFVAGRSSPDPSMPGGNLKVFRNISNCAPPATFEGRFVSLAELSLRYYFVGEAAAVMDIFKNVNDCCGPSVRQLDLFVRNERVPIVKLSEPILKSLSLELPHLETIRFSVGRVNLKNIDFLLPCRSLKQILLKYTKKICLMNKTKEKKSSGTSYPSASPEEVIQFTGYVNRLYESNVWELFPELRYVSIEVTTMEVGFGEGPGLAPLMRSGNKKLQGNPILPNDSVTTAKLYCREGYLRSQLK